MRLRSSIRFYPDKIDLPGCSLLDLQNYITRINYAFAET
jgi:hypothetical protein